MNAIKINISRCIRIFIRKVFIVKLSFCGFNAMISPDLHFGPCAVWFIPTAGSITVNLSIESMQDGIV